MAEDRLVAESVPHRAASLEKLRPGRSPATPLLRGERFGNTSLSPVLPLGTNLQ